MDPGEINDVFLLGFDERSYHSYSLKLRNLCGTSGHVWWLSTHFQGQRSEKICELTSHSSSFLWPQYCGNTMLEVETSLSRQDEHILFVSCALGWTMGVCSLVCVGVMAWFICNIRIEHCYCMVLPDISTVKLCACLQREAATWASDQPTEKLHRWHCPSRDCGPAASWTRQHERLHHAAHTMETAVLKAAPGHSLFAAQGHSPFSFQEQSPSWCWKKRSRKIVTDETWVSWALARQKTGHI